MRHASAPCGKFRYSSCMMARIPRAGPQALPAVRLLWPLMFAHMYKMGLFPRWPVGYLVGRCAIAWAPFQCRPR